MYQLDDGHLDGASSSVGEASSTQGGQDWKVKVITSRKFDLSDFCEETIAKFGATFIHWFKKVNQIHSTSLCFTKFFMMFLHCRP